MHHAPMPEHRYFISATGTDAGKTFVTASLIRELRARDYMVRALKPVASGVGEMDHHSDAALLADALALGLSPDAAAHALSAYSFRTPTAPDIAARSEGVRMEWESIVRFCTRPGIAQCTLIEGAGGLFSPLTDTKTNADLAATLGLPVLLVARCAMGAIGQILATLIAAQARDLFVAGIIINAPLGESVLTPSEMRDGLLRLAPPVLNGPMPRLCILPHVADGETPPPLVDALSLV